MKKLLTVTMLIIMALALVVAGCGGQEQAAAPPPAPADSDGSDGQDAAEPLKVALILSGPANDQGWNATALEGLQAAEAQFGVETAYMENIDIADTEAAYRDFAAQGFDLIIGHGYQFGDPAAAVSADFPDQFFMATEAGASSDNMASFVMSCEQGAYLIGMLCASMTESNIIGVVGAYEQPSITKELEAFKLGAAEVNPDCQVLEIYVNSYVDATLGYEAGMSMISQGADVLYQVANQAGTGTINAAAENGLYCCGNSYDQNSIAPDYLLCSTVYSMPLVITTAVQKVLDGEFEGGVFHLGMADGVVDISSYNNLASVIPQEVQDAVAAKKADIISGAFEVPVIETPTK